MGFEGTSKFLFLWLSFSILFPAVLQFDDPSDSVLSFLNSRLKSGRPIPPRSCSHSTQARYHYLLESRFERDHEQQAVAPFPHAQGIVLENACQPAGRPQTVHFPATNQLAEAVFPILDLQVHSLSVRPQFPDSDGGSQVRHFVLHIPSASDRRRFAVDPEYTVAVRIWVRWAIARVRLPHEQCWF